MPYFARGSSASRRPSPSRLTSGKVDVRAGRRHRRGARPAAPSVRSCAKISRLVGNNHCSLLVGCRFVKSPSDLTESFRAKGLKITPQRLRIFEVLHDSDRHPTAESVYDEVRVEMPTISLRTVYQTLNDLAGMGEPRSSTSAPARPASIRTWRHTITWSAKPVVRCTTSTPTSAVWTYLTATITASTFGDRDRLPRPVSGVPVRLIDRASSL